MRKVLASLAVACLASAATAQTFDPSGWPVIRYDTGHGGTSWKVTGPSGPSDWFNVRMDGSQTSGFVSYGILSAFLDTTGTGGSMKEISLRTSNAAGDPDVSAGGLIVAASSPVVVAGANPNNEHAWSCPQTTLGSDVHTTATWFAGDSNLWLASDPGAPSAGRSYWTLDGYATAGNAFSPDWVLGIVGFPASAEGSLLVNGATSDTITQGDTVCMTFTACQTGVGSVLVLVSPLFAGLGVPVLFTTTGNPFTGGPLSTQWTLCATTDCNTPSGGPFGFSAIYLDPCDLKPNGKPRAKLANTGFLTINADPKCSGLCFGMKDSGSGASYWAVQAPAGPSDYFNVNHGSPIAAAGVNNLTGIEIPALDTCGGGSSWAVVGIYPDNPALPGNPDLSSPFGTAASTAVSAGAADTTYPGQVYPIAPIAASTTTTYHAVVGWNPGETCIWVDADTAGTGSCADPIGPLTSSGWTLDGYATANNYVNYANWMMKIDWN